MTIIVQLLMAELDARGVMEAAPAWNSCLLLWSQERLWQLVVSWMHCGGRTTVHIYAEGRVYMYCDRTMHYAHSMTYSVTEFVNCRVCILWIRTHLIHISISQCIVSTLLCQCLRLFFSGWNLCEKHVGCFVFIVPQNDGILANRVQQLHIIVQWHCQWTIK